MVAATVPSIPAEILPMRRAHVRDVLEIERAVYPRPWSAALFFSELAQPKTRHYVIAVLDDKVIGYGGVMVHADEAHITNVAVEPDIQHRGVGRALMVNLMRTARERDANTVALEVRVSNWPAQRLYAWFGFRPIGVRKNYYAESGEDALVMMARDLQGDDIAARIARAQASLQS